MGLTRLPCTRIPREVGTAAASCASPEASAWAAPAASIHLCAAMWGDGCCVADTLAALR